MPFVEERRGATDCSPAVDIANVAEEVRPMSSDLYYNTVSYMLAKFLDVKRLLTKDVVLKVPGEVIKYMENQGPS